jgi:hypothetical protein
VKYNFSFIHDVKYTINNVTMTLLYC